MQIVEFLKLVVAEQLSLQDQTSYLEAKNDFTAQELADAVSFLFDNRAIKLELKDCIDVCGTGGSGLPRINTSTISAFILAKNGVKVAKHGNKAASGRFGSFDLLEELGEQILDDPGLIQTQFEQRGLVFLYAPSFYPVMKHFAPVRKVIAKPTFFNLLGPLLSPVKVKRQIIGTSFEDEMELIAETARLLGLERALVVRGEDGLDELTLTGKTRVIELRDGEFSEDEVAPEDFGIEECNFDEIAGGDAEFNVTIAKSILNGECETRHKDLVLLNVALAMYLNGEDDLKEAFNRIEI